METKQCSKCNELKLLNQFSKNKSFKDGFEYWCKSCKTEYRNNKAYKYKYKFDWKKYIQTQQKSRKKLLETNHLFKASCITRTVICNAFKRGGWDKKSKTQNILGCNFETFKNHIQKQFQPGMNWGNHGKWHFDHIIPISSATNEEEFVKLNHYTNFQPLWGIDNLKKSNN